LKNTLHKKSVGGVTQGVGPEFKHQYRQKNKNKNKNPENLSGSLINV
jgi:hypothetical protein